MLVVTSRLNGELNQRVFLGLDKNQCPLPGKCKTSSLIYQATVTSENEGNIESYIGLTEGTFQKVHHEQLLTSHVMRVVGNEAPQLPQTVRVL